MSITCWVKLPTGRKKVRDKIYKNRMKVVDMFTFFKEKVGEKNLIM